MSEIESLNTRLQGAVSQYCKRYYCHFIVHPICDRRSGEGTPFSAKAGCYALYAQDGDLLYVGKASLFQCVGNRLWHHFKKSRAGWMPNTAFVQVVEVEEPFEAPSLEEYLIRELQPRWNGTGRVN